MRPDSPKIEIIRERYKRSFTEKAQSFEQKLTELVEADHNLLQVLEDLHAMLHKLAGSAGMYGYTNISDTARSAMNVCNLNDIDELKACLQRLHNLLISSS